MKKLCVYYVELMNLLDKKKFESHFFFIYSNKIVVEFINTFIYFKTNQRQKKPPIINQSIIRINVGHCFQSKIYSNFNIIDEQCEDYYDDENPSFILMMMMMMNVVTTKYNLILEKEKWEREKQTQFSLNFFVVSKRFCHQQLKTLEKKSKCSIFFLFCFVFHWRNFSRQTLYVCLLYKIYNCLSALENIYKNFSTNFEHMLLSLIVRCVFFVSDPHTPIINV